MSSRKTGGGRAGLPSMTRQEAEAEVQAAVQAQVQAAGQDPAKAGSVKSNRSVRFSTERASRACICSPSRQFTSLQALAITANLLLLSSDECLLKEAPQPFPFD